MGCSMCGESRQVRQKLVDALLECVTDESEIEKAGNLGRGRRRLTAINEIVRNAVDISKQHDKEERLDDYEDED